MTPSSSSRPRLSVLIFTRNDAENLRACLGTILRAPPRLAFEVRVFENASSDRSLDVLKSFEDRLHLSWIKQSEETAFSIGNNRLLAEAHGELVVFLNPDTLPEGAMIDGCAALFSQPRDIGLVSPRLTYPDGAAQPTGWHLPSPGQLLREHLRLSPREVEAHRSGTTEVGWLMGCFLMAERDFICGLGGFDEAFWFHGTDLELCARVHGSGRPVLRLESHAMVHTGHRSWERPRRESSQLALTQWLRRDHGPWVASGVATAARLREALR
jgi:GT2 family glycosyltransferase